MASSGESTGTYKSEFIYTILVIDFLVVFIMILFINLLDRRYREYAELFDKRNVEMRDFTIEVQNLPYDIAYGGKVFHL